MLEALLEAWNQLPWLVRWPLNFGFSIIILRGVLGNSITSWLKQKNLVKDGQGSLTWKVLDFIYDTIIRVKTYLRDTIMDERTTIMWRHELSSAQNLGHSASIRECNDEDCQLLG